MSTDVPDGATQRHSRLIDLLAFINLYGKATTTQIQSHMMTTFGLRFKTTSDMIHELATAGAIKEDGHGFWYLTAKQQTVLKRVQAQEEADNAIDPLLREICKIKDEKLRERLLKKASDIWDAILKEKEKQAENQS